jgi:hypothetical protein
MKTSWLSRAVFLLGGAAQICQQGGLLIRFKRSYFKFAATLQRVSLISSFCSVNAREDKLFALIYSGRFENEKAAFEQAG